MQASRCYNAGLAVLLCLYLGMNLPLALMVCLGPLGGALAFIVIGAMIKNISFGQAGIEFMDGAVQATNGLGQAAGRGLQQIGDHTKSLWVYLTQQKPALGIGLLLLVSSITGAGLLFHFGLPLYAYILGIVTVGALSLLALGYIAKFAFDARNNRAESEAGKQSSKIEGEGRPGPIVSESLKGKQAVYPAVNSNLNDQQTQTDEPGAGHGEEEDSDLQPSAAKES